MILSGRDVMSGESCSNGAGKATVISVAYISGLICFLFIFDKMKFDADKGLDFSDLGRVSIAIGLALVVTITIRFVFAAPFFSRAEGQRAPTDASDATTAVRTRIAPLVLGVGGTAIIVFGLVIAIALSVLAYNKNDVVSHKIDTILLGLFATVLPVFSTWVGTILAFYFTNENYRQAAAIARDQSSAPKPSVADRMIPFAKIERIGGKRSELGKIKMEEVIAKLVGPITRMIIFDSEMQQPVYVIRKKSPPMPSEWLSDRAPWKSVPPVEKTVDDYKALNDGRNAVDATQFGFIATTASIDEARSALRTGNCTDLFVTPNGGRTEKTVGWITDDLLK